MWTNRRRLAELPGRRKPLGNGGRGNRSRDVHSRHPHSPYPSHPPRNLFRTLPATRTTVVSPSSTTCTSAAAGWTPCSCKRAGDPPSPALSPPRSASSPDLKSPNPQSPATLGLRTAPAPTCFARARAAADSVFAKRTQFLVSVAESVGWMYAKGLQVDAVVRVWKSLRRRPALRASLR